MILQWASQGTHTVGCIETFSFHFTSQWIFIFMSINRCQAQLPVGFMWRGKERSLINGMRSKLFLAKVTLLTVMLMTSTLDTFCQRRWEQNSNVAVRTQLNNVQSFGRALMIKLLPFGERRQERSCKSRDGLTQLATCCHPSIRREQTKRTKVLQTCAVCTAQTGVHRPTSLQSPIFPVAFLFSFFGGLASIWAQRSLLPTPHQERSRNRQTHTFQCEHLSLPCHFDERWANLRLN